jgi:glucose/arabinose dehydrogenase
MRLLVAALVLLFLPLGGCLSQTVPSPATEEVATPEPGTSAGFALQRVAGGFNQPLLVTHAGDDRLFVVEQGGTIQLVDGDWSTPRLWLDISSRISAGGERGLLGLAFAPDYATTGRFYVSFTATDGASVLERWVGTKSEEILRVAQPYANHNGGHIAFGPDGYLYLGLGDGGLAADPNKNGQNKATLLGSILRLDVSAATGYAAPRDNPFVGDATGADEVWAYGLRNPWRFTFDRVTGDLWIADVGQDEWEEVNFQPAASQGGQNYGWAAYEGTHLYPGGIAVNHVFPVAEYANANGDCSVTGGHVYRGGAVPALTGAYLLGDYCSGKIRAVVYDDGWRLFDWYAADLRISSFGEDVSGELYVVDHQGAIHQFVAA